MVAELEAIARADGHRVTRLSVDMRPATATGRRPRRSPDRVGRGAGVLPLPGRASTAFERLDTRRYDLVVSTQPPSFAADHPRHLSVFFHHHRVFYDLEEAYLRAGFAPDPEVHREAGELVRELDQPVPRRVGWFLAGSASVAGRLARFNGLTDASVFHAGLGSSGDAGTPRDPASHRPGALRRPPRVPQAHRAGRGRRPPAPRTAVLASSAPAGGVAWAQALDHRLATTGADPAALTDAELWCNTGAAGGSVPVPAGHRSNVEFAGRVDDADLARRYRGGPVRGRAGVRGGLRPHRHRGHGRRQAGDRVHRRRRAHRAGRPRAHRPGRRPDPGRHRRGRRAPHRRPRPRRRAGRQRPGPRRRALLAAAADELRAGIERVLA